jgi:very-short-patch-repair endonuclease
MTWIDIALAQAGAITTAQLRASGMVKYRVVKNLGEGVLVPGGRRGIYLLAAAPRTWLQELSVELLAAGDGAYAWRRSAARLWGLDGFDRVDGVIDVAVPASRRPRRSAATRCDGASADIHTVQGLHCTGPGRTVIDLGSTCDDDEVERALESALRRRLVTLDQITLLAASSTRLGAPALRRVLDRRPAGAPPTESDAETCFLQIARNAGLPCPERQVRVVLRGRRYRLDAAWRPIRLAAEVDGAATHGPDRLTADLHRQNLVVLDGWMVLRFSAARVMGNPQAVGRDLVEAYRLRWVEMSHFR